MSPSRWSLPGDNRSRFGGAAVCRRGLLTIEYSRQLPITLVRTRCPMPISTPSFEFAEARPLSPKANGTWLSIFGDFPALLDDLPISWFESVKVSDRRSEPRCWCDSQAWLSPIDDPAASDPPPAIPISLTDISRHGIGFSHTAPLPYRLIQISFESDDAPAPILVVRLQWCRFRRPGSYESGGQIQRVVAASPVSSEAD